MSMMNQIKNEEFDAEWIHLILAARNMGLSMDDVRSFLKSPLHTMRLLSASAANAPIYPEAGYVGTASM